MMREIDDRVAYRRAVGFAADVLHETPVDLETVDRESLQIAERGMPGTEVVQRAPDTGSAQRGERVHRAVDIVHDRTFGELDFRQLAADGVRSQRAFDVFDQALAAKLPG